MIEFFGGFNGRDNRKKQKDQLIAEATRVTTELDNIGKDNACKREMFKQLNSAEMGDQVVIGTDEGVMAGNCRWVAPAGPFNSGKLSLSAMGEGEQRVIFEIILPKENVFAPVLGRGIHRERVIETERIKGEISCCKIDDAGTATGDPRVVRVTSVKVLRPTSAPKDT